MKYKEKEGASVHECSYLLSAYIAGSDSRVSAPLKLRLSAVGRVSSSKQGRI